MFRSSNKEGEQVVHASQPLAPEKKSTPQARPQILSRGLALGEKATKPAPYARGGLSPRVARRLREHIDSNIEDRISVDSMAKLANLSVCYFVRAFKQSFGLTPHDYVIQRRVERTRELLLGTDMSLSDIALAAGFSDQSHCARRFRQHFGMSPREYRWSIP